MPESENRYKFCGLPIGVNMLPRLAAIVISVTVPQSLSVKLIISKIIMPKGTKVISETSLVINMLLMKHKNISVNTMPRLVFTLINMRLPINCKKFCSRRPSIISIRQNSMMSVLKSI